MTARKEAILKAAANLFAERGFNETSMAELAKVTGVAQGTIFYHFNNKEELFLKVLDDFRTSITQEFENHIKEKNFTTGLEKVEGALNFYLYLAGSMEERFRILHRHHAYELARINPVCRVHLESIYSCLVDIFEKAILLGQQDGSIREMDARKAALIIYTMVDGLVRFNTYDLYDGGVLSNELFESCRRILENNKSC
ncbi:MAG: TetR/AcrR family transcriptional regulator [Deltaproteobacteria bacterium HGW-Deltaproteobacteria-15]|jgi:AcrR family transcriptional regulator|nr:MAG: TetR/AcrR family transcriptional regulator [Deltaproteobacteria bacterium HGW-Deltaproteobacteria-15]